MIFDVNIDYSKPTRFTKGIIGSNIWRLKTDTAVRMGMRTAVRKITG